MLPSVVKLPPLRASAAWSAFRPAPPVAAVTVTDGARRGSNSSTASRTLSSRDFTLRNVRLLVAPANQRLMDLKKPAIGNAVALISNISRTARGGHRLQ